MNDRSPLWRRYPRLFGPDPRADADDELRFHIEERTDELIARGMDAEAARSEAIRRIGDVDALRRELRGAGVALERTKRRRESVAGWWRDVRFAQRRLLREPAFTAAALGTLVLGMGTAVAMFTVVNAVILRPLPYPEPDRLVRVAHGGTMNTAMVDAIRTGTPSLDAVTGISTWFLTLTGEGPAASLGTQFVDADFFGVFGEWPALGRPFRADEREPSRSDVVILSHDLWHARFGGDATIIGRRIELDGGGHTTREVIGVMPRGFTAPLESSRARVDAWAPLSLAPGRTIATDSTHYIDRVVGRLSAEGTTEQAAQEVRATFDAIQRDYGHIIDEQVAGSAGAADLLDSIVGRVERPLWVLLATVGLVLLLASANLANLMLARAERRRREVAVRAAIGAGRGRLVREQFIESLLLAVLGGGGGILLARGVLGILRVAEAAGLPRAAEYTLDVRVLGFTFATSLLAAILFGLLPAVRATAGDLRDELAAGGRSQGPTRAGRRIGFVLVASQVAFALVIVVGAGLLLGSLRALRAVNPGLDTQNVLAVEITPSVGRYSGARHTALFDEIRERFAALPGVHGVGAIQLLPFTSGNWAFPYLAEGQVPRAGAPLPRANFRFVSPGYFRTVGVPVIDGRDIMEDDDERHVRVGLINRTLAATLWPGESAIGREVRVFGSESVRVVGVVGDVHQHALDRAPEPEIYVPHAQWPWATSLIVMVKTAVPPSTLVSAVRRTVHEIDPNVPVVSARPLEDVLGESMQERRFFAGVLTFFGLLALALGAVGVYGVMSYAMSARTSEFGVRAALGATRAAVLRQGLAAGMAPVFVGVVAGVAGALAASGLLAGLLFGVGPHDATTVIAASLVLAFVALAAVAIPVWRVSRIEPNRVLRAQ